MGEPLTLVCGQMKAMLCALGLKIGLLSLFRHRGGPAAAALGRVSGTRWLCRERTPEALQGMDPLGLGGGAASRGKP